MGYYTFTAMAQDKAGNKSEEVVRIAVNDNEPPRVGLIVGGYDKGAWSLTATLTDNLSVKAYWAEASESITLTGGASQVLILPREGGVMVDEYNSPMLTQSHLTTPPITMQVFRALQAGDPGTAPENIDWIQVVATDHAGIRYEDATATPPVERRGYGSARTLAAALGAAADLDRFGLIASPATGLAAGDGTGEFSDDALTYSRDEVFQSVSAADTEVDDGVVELRAEIVGTTTYVEAAEAVTGDNPDTPDVTETDFVITAAVAGAEGLVNNPVSRVDFYAAVTLRDISTANTNNRIPPVAYGAGTEALKFIASASAAGAEDDATTRTYSWSADVSEAAFLAAVAGADGNYTAGDIIAVFVNSDGVALAATPVPITVTD